MEGRRKTNPKLSKKQDKLQSVEEKLKKIETETKKYKEEVQKRHEEERQIRRERNDRLERKQRIEKHWETLNWITKIMEEYQGEVRNRAKMEKEQMRHKDRASKWKNLTEEDKKKEIYREERHKEGSEEEKRQERLMQAKLMKKQWTETYEKSKSKLEEKGEKEELARPDEQYWGKLDSCGDRRSWTREIPPTPSQVRIKFCDDLPSSEAPTPNRKRKKPSLTISPPSRSTDDHITKKTRTPASTGVSPSLPQVASLSPRLQANILIPPHPPPSSNSSTLQAVTLDRIPQSTREDIPPNQASQSLVKDPKSLPTHISLHPSNNSSTHQARNLDRVPQLPHVDIPLNQALKSLVKDPKSLSTLPLNPAQSSSSGNPFPPNHPVERAPNSLLASYPKHSLTPSLLRSKVGKSLPTSSPHQPNTQLVHGDLQQHLPLPCQTDHHPHQQVQSEDILGIPTNTRIPPKL